MGNFEYDFAGWATRNDIRCSDGRTIRSGAFSNQNGEIVPLVWNHQHNAAENVLGHALLEDRSEGVYAYCAFNDSESGKTAKELVRHGDVNALSIFANHLKQKGGDVMHGAIREVSLVLSGANPGAYIDTVMEHGDEDGESAVIYTDTYLDDAWFMHDDGGDGGESADSGEDSGEENTDEDNNETDDADDESEEVDDTAEVLNSMNESQRDAVDALIDQVLADKGVIEDNPDVDADAILEHLDTLNDKQQDAVINLASQVMFEHGLLDDEEDEKMFFAHAENSDDLTVGEVIDSMTEEQKTAMYAVIGQILEENGITEGGTEMKHNLFDEDYEYNEDVLMHSEGLQAILDDAKHQGSLRDSFIAHAADYGIQNIDWLFPEYKNVDGLPPQFINNEPSEWVQIVMNGVHKTPFSRIKSMYADIREDEARARGYLKGKLKKEEVFSLLKRTTDPQTVYKKQKLDRDDIVDITDFDVVSWIKGEMRLKLDEELARAILVGDGRLASDDDHIQENHIRPIINDSELYTIQKTVTPASGESEAHAIINTAIRSRAEYRGSGNPIMFTTEATLADMLLLEDTTGRRIYKDVTELATALRVSKIVTFPYMPSDIYAFYLNLNDYNVGADKGGSVNMFDDFDIDYNQQKYLIETRCSGAMIKPFSAVVLKKDN
jgi:HK97 family phage prohead protease